VKPLKLEKQESKTFSKGIYEEKPHASLTLITTEKEMPKYIIEFRTLKERKQNEEANLSMQ